METTIKSLLGIDKLNKLKKEQLILQEQMDSKLQTLDCHDIISGFVFKHRRFSRDIQISTLDLGLFEISKGIEKEIQHSIITSKEIINTLNLNIDNYKKCYKLSQYNHWY